MKKLSLLIALCLLVSVGGVYAAWVYADGAVADRSNDHAVIGITGSTNTSEKGVFALTNSIEILIDDEKFVKPTDPSATAYKAIFTGTGEFTVSFTPSAGAPADVVANGIKMQLELSLTGVDDDVLKLGTTEVVLNSGNATKHVVVPAQDIIDCLILNNGAELILDTYAEYEAFKADLGAPVLNITVSEITTTP